MITDLLGRPVVLHLTGGNVSDITAAPELIERVDRCGWLIADKAYDADSLRKALRERQMIPVIPGRSNRKRSIRYDRRRYRERWRVEDGYCRLKDFRRVATRYDKLARNFLAGVMLAAVVVHWL